MGNESAIDTVARDGALTEDANRRALATPLPGPLSDAFLNDAIDVGGGYKVRRFVASDWPLLQWLDSPFYRLILEAQKEVANQDPIKCSDEEEWEACWQFTHLPKQCRELKSKGRETFRTKATEEMADSISPLLAKKMVAAISQQIFNSFSTAIKYGSDGDGDSKKN